MVQSLSPEMLVYGLPVLKRPRVSPDGAQIVYELVQAEPSLAQPTVQLWQRAIDGGNPRRVTSNGARNRNPQWSPDGRHIAFVSDRGDGTGIFVLTVGGSAEPREITRHRYDIDDLAWSPDGGRLAYVTLIGDPEHPDDEETTDAAVPPIRVVRRIDYKQDGRGYLNDARMHVFVVDVATGARQMVTNRLVDHHAPQWSPDGSLLAVQVLNRIGLSSQLALISLATGATEVIGPADGNIGAWAWSPDGSQIVFAGGAAQPWQTDLFVYSVATRVVRQLTDDLACLPQASIPAGYSKPAHPVWLDDRRVLVHAFRAGASGLYVLDTDGTSGTIEQIHRWDGLNDGLSVDRARRYVVQGHRSLERASAISVFDWASGEARIITVENGSGVADVPLPGWERFWVQREGIEMEAWLLKPPGFEPAKRYPLVLDIHGGPHSYHGYSFGHVQQCLASHGFLVAFANPRGSGTYGRDFALDVIGDWGGEDSEDLMAVVDEVLTRPYADDDRIGIHGYSYGGYMTALTIGRTHRFRAAVCGAPVFDLESFYGTSDVGHTFGAFEWGGAPHERREWCVARSPSSIAHQTRTPTLILHGEADERCPIGQGEQMFIALKTAGCDVEFVRYPGASHALSNEGPLKVHQRTGWTS